MTRITTKLSCVRTPQLAVAYCRARPSKGLMKRQNDNKEKQSVSSFYFHFFVVLKVFFAKISMGILPIKGFDFFFYYCKDRLLNSVVCKYK